MITGKIFVFGSNLAGRHGKGSALEALKHHGAIYWQGRGLQGSSYAIATKDERLRILPLDYIKLQVDAFLDFVERYPDFEYTVVAIGCGLAGYQPEQIAPFFAKAPSNVLLPPEFVRILRP